MRAVTSERPVIKVNQVVYNARWCQWGQVMWDARKFQFETGTPETVLVFEFNRGGSMNWPLDDISAVVVNKQIAWKGISHFPRIYPIPDPEHGEQVSEATQVTCKCGHPIFRHGGYGLCSAKGCDCDGFSSAPPAPPGDATAKLPDELAEAMAGPMPELDGGWSAREAWRAGIERGFAARIAADARERETLAARIADLWRLSGADSMRMRELCEARDYAKAQAAERAKQIAELRAIVDTFPKDRNGVPITLGAMATATGGDMGDAIDGDGEPHAVTSICGDHVWLEFRPGDQSCWLANQITLAAPRPTAADGQGDRK